MNKRIAVLFEFPTLNGGERSMLAVLKQLSNRAGLEFTALAPKTGLLADELERQTIRHLPFCVRDESNHKRPVGELLASLRQVADDAAADVVHANSLSMSRLLGQLGADHPGFIRTGHLRDIIRLNRTVIGDLNNNQQLIAVSAATRQFHIDQGLSEANCQVIYNGVDTDEFRLRDRLEMRAKLLPKIASDATMILNVGQICLRKGQPALADCVCELLNERDDLHLVIVGTRHSAKFESAEFERSIRAKFQVASREQNLHVLGHRNDVASLMNAADLLAHVAHQEPFGRVLLEAAASRLPILATNVGGTSEMLGPNEAHLIPPDCPASLADGLRLMLSDEDLRTSLATAARKTIESKFKIASASERLADFWHSC